MNGPFAELPFRDMTVEAACYRLMTDRGETLDDVTWVLDVPMRAADFDHCIMTTKRHVYAFLRDDWEGDGAYTVRIFVAATRSTTAAVGTAGNDADEG